MLTPLSIVTGRQLNVCCYLYYFVVAEAAKKSTTSEVVPDINWNSSDEDDVDTGSLSQRHGCLIVSAAEKDKLPAVQHASTKSKTVTKKDRSVLEILHVAEETTVFNHNTQPTQVVKLVLTVSSFSSFLFNACFNLFKNCN